MPEQPKSSEDTDGSGAGADCLERTLLQVRELIESAVSLHRNGVGQTTALVPVTDEDAVRGAIEELVSGAEHRLGIIMPAEVERAQPVVPLLGQISAAARRGVEVRILARPQVVRSMGLLTAAHDTVGYEVRVSEMDLQGVVIADGRVAFGRTGPHRACVYASVIPDPMAVRTLDLMFAANWRGAQPLAAYLRLAESLRTDSARLVLGRLRAGRTDHAAAREMQVSLRTYRRHVAAIMRDVGANSRFQAGVLAVELGLLAECD